MPIMRKKKLLALFIACLSVQASSNASTLSRYFQSNDQGKKEPGSNFLEPGIYLATTYSHKTYRLNTIGAAAFHFRVRNGTGWFHRALVTRGQPRLSGLGL